MSGKLVSCTNLDSVPIEVLGGSRAVTIPAALALGCDAVLRHCLRHGCDLSIVCVDGVWHAMIPGGRPAKGHTPWGAMLALANALSSQ